MSLYLIENLDIIFLAEVLPHIEGFFFHPYIILRGNPIMPPITNSSIYDFEVIRQNIERIKKEEKEGQVDGSQQGVPTQDQTPQPSVPGAYY